MYTSSATRQSAAKSAKRTVGFILIASALAIALSFLLGAQIAHADSLTAGNADLKPDQAAITYFKSKTPGKVTVKVGAVTDASGYQFLIARNASFTKSKLSKKKTSRTVTFAELTEGKTYYAKVRAYKFMNGKKVWGPWSSVKKAKVKKDPNVTRVKLRMTLKQMASWQPPYTAGVKKSVVQKLLDPANVKSGTAAYYQFANLKGYSGLTAAQINNYIASTYAGRNGKLKGKGSYFVAAAKKYNINECYLVSHAILESGWGTSELAKGFKYNGKTYYNFYGIGAYDGNALWGGRGAAVKYGWTSPKKAILGAAKFVSTYYANRDQYPQDTLYGMKWDYRYSSSAMTRGWHQYASDPYWPSSISTIMGELYTHAGFKPTLTYTIPQYK